MEENGESKGGLKAIRNKANDASWFRNTPHYWAEASFPLAYAVACVEVVCKSSEKARILYNRIIEAWSDARLKAVFDKIDSIKPDVIGADSYLLTIARTLGCLPFHAYIRVV